jgi:hypothetical protein
MKRKGDGSRPVQETSGWAKGTKEFKKAVLADQKDAVVRKAVEVEASETREPSRERGLSEALELLDRKESDLLNSRKGAEWEVAARWLRERYLAPHRWIAARLS